MSTDISLMIKAILPELGLTVLTMVILALGLIRKALNPRLLGWVTAAALVIISAVSVVFSQPGDQSALVWGGMLRFDMASFVFRMLFLAGAALTALFTCTDDTLQVRPEFFLLLVVSTLGMSLMAASADLLMLFLAIETASIPLYVMAGAKLKDDRSVEAGIKYFLFGAMSTALMLYGFSLFYGFSGTTRLDQISVIPNANQVPGLLIALAFIFVIAGFAFKISAVPFHFWAPDVYTGAPTPVAGFLSTASKAAGFAVLLRVLFGFFPQGSGLWTWTIVILAIASMLIGNLAALAQKEIKRLIAYSSIAHAGYILVGVASANQFGAGAAIYYLIAYLVTNLLVFGVIGIVTRQSKSDSISEFAGLSRRSPGLALLMLAGILSLGGIPPFAGFFAKVLVFGAAVQTGMAWLAFIGVINSVVALVYYLRILKVMYLDPAAEDAPALSLPKRWVIAAGLCLVGLVVFGVIFTPWFTEVMKAASAYM